MHRSECQTAKTMDARINVGQKIHGYILQKDILSAV